MLADISRTRYFFEADGAGGPQPQEPDEGAAPARPRVSPEEVLEGIHTLKGAEQFIDLCEEIHRMAPALRGAGLVDVLGDRSYLFSIDPGSGLNSAVNLFTSLFIAEGFVPPDFAPLQLTLPPGDEEADVFEPILSALAQTENKLLLIDLVNWTEQADDPQLRSFLTRLTEAGAGMLFVFVVPYMELNSLKRISAVLNDVMTVVPVTFYPLTVLQLRQTAQEWLGSRGFAADEDTMDLIGQRLAQEKSDGRFYGVQTVRKIVSEMIWQKVRTLIDEEPEDIQDVMPEGGPEEEDEALPADGPGEEDGAEPAGVGAAAAETQEDDDSDEEDPPVLISPGDLPGFVEEERLFSMTKEELLDLIEPVFVRTQSEELLEDLQEKGRDGFLNFCFTGRQGTGRSRTGRILARIFRLCGILSRGWFFEISADDIVGEGGWRAVTRMFNMCMDARDSVLYIGDARRLMDREAAGALGTLIAQMHSMQGRMCVILECSREDFEALSGADPSLAACIAGRLDFPDLDRRQMAEVFLDMMRSAGFSAGPGLEEALSSCFGSLTDEMIRSSDFSNARFVRNFFESTCSKSIMRSQMEEQAGQIITAGDLAAAGSEGAQAYFAKRSRHVRMGFHLGE